MVNPKNGVLEFWEVRNGRRTSLSALHYSKTPLLRLFTAAHGAQEHQHPKYEQHHSPNEVDVDLTAARVGDGRVVAGDAIKGKQRADESEHQSDWPANIESHNFIYD